MDAMPKAKNKPGFFSKPTTAQCRDAGLALILILLLFIAFGKNLKLAPWTILVTLLLMVQPKLFKPWAALWFGLSEVLGTVMSKVILSLLFFVLVTPVALVRKMRGADAMKMKLWKSGSDSVFRIRNQRIAAADLEKMF
jgi:hypothetical protein